MFDGTLSNLLQHSTTNASIRSGWLLLAGTFQTGVKKCCLRCIRCSVQCWHGVEEKWENSLHRRWCNEFQKKKKKVFFGFIYMVQFSLHWNICFSFALFLSRIRAEVVAGHVFPRCCYCSVHKHVQTVSQHLKHVRALILSVSTRRWLTSITWDYRGVQGP